MGVLLLECIVSYSMYVFCCWHGNRKQEEAQYVPHAAETAAFEEASRTLRTDWSSPLYLIRGSDVPVHVCV